MFLGNFAFSQDTIKKDTIYVNDTSFEESAVYGARDSIYIDLKTNKIHLYGEAYLQYLDTDMKAGYIVVDLKKNEVLASYIYDKDSNKIESPKFKNGAEAIDAAKIRYNFNSQKGYIEEVKIKQDEIYLYMGVAKRQKNGDIHFKQGRFSTCEFIEDPHYHFQLSRAVMIPEKKIVTGPMNLWIKGIPTPFGLPFSIIPQSKTRTHGLLFPQIVPISAAGFGVRDLGYFFPISPTVHTSAYATLFSRGSWGLKNTTDYFTQYKRKGSFTLSYQELKAGFPSKSSSDKFSVIWTHQKDLKSNPFWNFSSNVNFMSDNKTKNNLDPINTQYFNNQLNSDINLQRFFPGKPVTLGLKISLKQNTSAKTISLASPVFNLNVTRFSPFKNSIKGSSEWKQFFARIAISYNLESQNRSTFQDSLLTHNKYKDIQNQFLNGIYQSATLQSTVGFFKNTWKFNPSIVYTNRINFQQLNQTYNSTTKKIESAMIQKYGTSNDLSFNASLTTVVYAYYRFVGKKSQPLLRHILTPSFSFRYIPNLNSNSYVDTGSVNLTRIKYSPFANSMYSVSSTSNQAIISFGFNNTFELKRKSEKDTITGFKKTRLIDALSLNGQYDLIKDTMKLSDMSLGLRISPAKSINFVGSSTLSPYDWNPSTGRAINKISLNSNGKIGRLTSTSLTTTYTFTSKQSQNKIDDIMLKNGANWNADYQYFNLHPEQIISFDIPWKLNVSHVYSITANTSKNSISDVNFKSVQTIQTNGDLSFTKRWKIVGSVNFDVKTVKVTYTTLTLTRDMHCWYLAFNWIPIGGNQSFLFSLRSTSNMFKDAKLDLRKPPLFFN